MATIGYTPAKPFLQGAADLCLRLISQFNPQNIANAIWAFAKFSFNPGRYAMSAGLNAPHAELKAVMICQLAQKLLLDRRTSRLAFHCAETKPHVVYLCQLLPKLHHHMLPQ